MNYPSSSNHYVETEHSTNLQWSKYEINYNLNALKVHLWKINTLEHFNLLFKNYRALLAEQEYARARKYCHELNFKRLLTGRIVVKLLGGKYLSESAGAIHLSTDSLKPRII